MSGKLDRLYEKGKYCFDELQSFLYIPKCILNIGKVINKPTYFPEMERKSKKEMWKENLLWILKYRELNKFYTSYGFDIRDFRNQEEYIPNRLFRILRKKGNQRQVYSPTGNYHYIVALRDKYLFAAYIASTMGKEYVVDSQGLICHAKAYDCAAKTWMSLEQFLETKGTRVFKVIDGECADGVMLVEVCQDHVLVDGQRCSKADFIREHGNKRMIVQDVVQQHEALQVFGTKCVNTIRAVTIQGKSGEISVFAAFLRLGATKDSFVDNRAKGGLGVGIDLDTGKLQQYGFPHDHFGVRTDVHPLSGVRFEGYQLPFWKETVELICNAHRQFYDIQSIGWDVVLTPHGPILLEGNDDWEIGGPQDTGGGLKKRWYECVEK